MHIFDISQLKNYFLEFVSWSRHTATNGPQSTARSKERIFLKLHNGFSNIFQLFFVHKKCTSII